MNLLQTRATELYAFQFLYGTIKIEATAEKATALITFQFLYGTIKIRTPTRRSYLDRCFNSYMVRLK